MVEHILTAVEHLLQQGGVGLKIVRTWLQGAKHGLQPLPLPTPIVNGHGLFLTGTEHEELDKAAQIEPPLLQHLDVDSHIVAFHSGIFVVRIASVGGVDLLHLADDVLDTRGRVLDDVAGAVDVLKTEFVDILQLCLGESAQIVRQHLPCAIGDGVIARSLAVQDAPRHFEGDTLPLPLSGGSAGAGPLLLKEREGAVEPMLIKRHTGSER